MTGTSATFLNARVDPAVFARFQQMTNIFPGLLSWALARFGVPDALGEAPLTAQELAARVGANADAVHRMMFMLASQGIFTFESGRFGHSPLSILLRSDHPQSPSQLRYRPPILREVLSMMEHTLRTGCPGTELLHPDALFGHLERNPEDAKTFDEMMANRSREEVAGVAGAYDFSRFATIADIGGGHGHLIRAVLQNTPSAEGILFDLPRTIEPLTKTPMPRLRLMAGDFFKDKLPAADAYLLMNIIHDWADEKAIAILRNVRSAAPAGAKLLVIGMLMPSEPIPHPALQLDILMLLVAGGRERNEAEHRALLNAAGFHLERIVPTQSPISILEATPAH